MLRRILTGLGYFLLAFLVYFVVTLFVPVTWGEPRYSPSGEHYMQISSMPYHSFLPAFPGQGSDQPGYVTVFTAAGKRCGRAPVPMVWMAYEFVWQPGEAYIPVVASWNLTSCQMTRLD